MVSAVSPTLPPEDSFAVGSCNPTRYSLSIMTAVISTSISPEESHILALLGFKSIMTSVTSTS